jgi:transcriptional regulator with XRE-family HTH domain
LLSLSKSIIIEAIQQEDLTMSDDDYRRVFVKKLRYYMEKNGKNQMDLMRDLGLSSATVSSWCNGKKLPRMGKIQMLADYFGIEKSDLLEEKDDSETYYIDEETRELADFLHKNPDYKVLFDASRKVKPEDIEFVKEMIDRMTGGDTDG